MINKRWREVANKTKSKTFELSDLTDNLGTIYLGLLFSSGIIWAFIAINNFETPTLFKLALIYSILLIFGFLGVSFDRRHLQLGLDSRIWEGKGIKKKLVLSVVLFALWYLVFMSSGFSVASAYSVTGALFTVSPAVNFFLTAVLGPIAENIFFFGVINMTLIYVLRSVFDAKDARTKSIVIGLILMASSSLFTNVPNSLYILLLAGGLTIATGVSKNEFLMKHAPIAISALFIGGVIFPKFHSFAYQLNESSYIAAQVFGIAVCIIAAYIGMLPVDILHISNNAAVAIGLG
jgi:hypothetical protein